MGRVEFGGGWACAGRLLGYDTAGRLCRGLVWHGPARPRREYGNGGGLYCCRRARTPRLMKLMTAFSPHTNRKNDFPATWNED